MRVIFLGVVLLWNLTGCVSHEVKRFSPGPTDSYQSLTIDRGLMVAAEPFITKENAESAFTIDVTKRGFAPVLLVLENRTADDMLLIKDDIEFIDSRGRTHKPVSAKVMASRLEHEKVVYPPAGLGLLPYAWADNANATMLQDWTNKEVATEQVLTPYQKTHGFVYFYLGRALNAMQHSTVKVPVVNVRTGERRKTTVRIVLP